MAAKTLNKNYLDMTAGPILAALVRFSVPMMIGGLFQDLYSMVDMTIAGYTLGDHAIAAISASAAILNMMNYSARGFNMGTSILVSNAFGEGDMEKTKKALIAMNVLSVIISVIFTTGFLVFLNPLLRMVNTPAELYDEAKLYALIIIVGLFFCMFYNVFACAFRALGNSKLPLYYLIFTSVLNIILDYVFIVWFRWGVAGAAWATIFSQLVSAVLSGISFFRLFPEMRFSLSEIKDVWSIIPDMFTVGISVAVTNSIYAIGAVAIQGAVNALGSETIIAQSAAQKVRMFATIPSGNIASACATFAAQNYGARNYDRIRKGLLTGVGFSAAINVVTYIIVFFLGGPLTRLITNTASDQVVYMSATMLRIECLFIWAQTAVMGYRMSIQSLKRKIVPMLGTGIELVIRTLFAFVVTPLIGFRAISYAEAASWLISGASMVISFYILINGLKSGKYKQI